MTPEAVPLDLPLADIGSRAIALVLDLLITGATMVLLVIAISTFESGLGPLPGWIGVSLALVFFVLLRFGYPIAFETLWRGRTPGMAALGLRVVTADGGPIRFRHAALRGLMGIVDFELTAGIAAFLSALFTRRAQRLGDLVAGTVVLRERRGHGRARPVRFAPPVRLRGYLEPIDVAHLSSEDYARVRAVLLRAPQLPAAVRDRLARRMLGLLGDRVPAPPPGVSAEEALVAVAAAYQARTTESAATPAPVAPSPGPPGSSPQPPGPSPQPPGPSPQPSGPSPDRGAAPTVPSRESADERPPAGGFHPPT